MKNVFKRYPNSKQYYFTHPWIFFKDTFYNIKYAFQRATKGYCNADLWNIDMWLINVLPNAFSTFRDRTHSYPASFESMNEWYKILDTITQKLINADENNPKAEKKNPYKYICGREDLVNPELSITMSDDEDIKENNYNYFKEENKLCEWRSQEIKEAFKMIGEYFFNLWD